MSESPNQDGSGNGRKSKTSNSPPSDESTSSKRSGSSSAEHAINDGGSTSRETSERGNASREQSPARNAQSSSEAQFDLSTQTPRAGTSRTRLSQQESTTPDVIISEEPSSPDNVVSVESSSSRSFISVKSKSFDVNLSVKSESDVDLSVKSKSPIVNVSVKTSPRETIISVKKTSNDVISSEESTSSDINLSKESTSPDVNISVETTSHGVNISEESTSHAVIISEESTSHDVIISEESTSHDAIIVEQSNSSDVVILEKSAVERNQTNHNQSEQTPPIVLSPLKAPPSATSRSPVVTSPSGTDDQSCQYDESPRFRQIMSQLATSSPSAEEDRELAKAKVRLQSLGFIPSLTGQDPLKTPPVETSPTGKVGLSVANFPSPTRQSSQTPPSAIAGSSRTSPTRSQHPEPGLTSPTGQSSRKTTGTESPLQGSPSRKFLSRLEGSPSGTIRSLEVICSRTSSEEDSASPYLQSPDISSTSPRMSIRSKNTHPLGYIHIFIEGQSRSIPLYPPEEPEPPRDQSSPKEPAPLMDQSLPEVPAPPMDQSPPEDPAPPRDQSPPEEPSPPINQSPKEPEI